MTQCLIDAREKLLKVKQFPLIFDMDKLSNKGVDVSLQMKQCEEQSYIEEFVKLVSEATPRIVATGPLILENLHFVKIIFESCETRTFPNIFSQIQFVTEHLDCLQI